MWGGGGTSKTAGNAMDIVCRKQQLNKTNSKVESKELKPVNSNRKLRSQPATGIQQIAEDCGKRRWRRYGRPEA